jgi:hypothetical protein
MKSKIAFLTILIAVLANLVSAQSNPPPSGTISDDQARRMADEQAIRERRDAERREAEFRRLKEIADGKNPETRRVLGGPRTPARALHPSLNEQDKQATLILPEDLKQYADFLKQPKTGIIRLQNADNCSPSDLVVKASAVCPNNISGKATAFSFRAGTYKLPLFSDMFFKGSILMASGAFTIGIYSNLGDQDIILLNSSSKGVKELLDFQPPERENEIERQYSILKRGVQIGDLIYRGAVGADTNKTYVMRSIAYKGTIPRGEKPGTINLLAADERKDVTVVFRIVRQNSDGSIVLLWKELSRAKPPKIVLEAKGIAAKNEFTK